MAAFAAAPHALPLRGLPARTPFLASSAFAPPGVAAPARRCRRVPRARLDRPSRSSAAAANDPADVGAGGRGGGGGAVGGDSAQRSLASLHELTERIADLLHVGSLTDYGGKDLLCPKDAPMYTPVGMEDRFQVVVVFGKRLIGDKISVEYAKRIVTLVKQIACGAVRPDTIVFTGGRGSGAGESEGHAAGGVERSGSRFRNGERRDDGGAIGGGASGAARNSSAGERPVSEAAAGYLFFRSVCEEVGLDTDAFDYILEEQSCNTKESMANLLLQVRSRFGADAVSGCHFTLVSSDYHLIRIQEVHRTCPRHSLLFALDVASASWACIFAAYPFCVSPEPATAFLGRAMVLANDLSIVLVNLRGVVSDRQFFARENIARLNATSAKMRDMFRVVDPTRAVQRGGFRVDMRAYSETLERAIHAVREVQELVAPLVDPCGSPPPPADLELAEELLTQAVADMRDQLDPDRPLRVMDHVDIVEDLTAYVGKNAKAESMIPRAQPTISTADIQGFPRVDRTESWFGKDAGGDDHSDGHGDGAHDSIDTLHDSGSGLGSGDSGGGVDTRDHLDRSSRRGRGNLRGSMRAAESPTARTAAPTMPREGHDAYTGARDVMPAAAVAKAAPRRVAVMHKRIARDGPHLILVDSDDQSQHQEAVSAPSAAPQRTRRPRAKQTASAGSTVAARELPRAGGPDVTPGRGAAASKAPRRRKATGVVGKAASTIGAKRKTPVKRTASAKADAATSKAKTKVKVTRSPKA